MPGAPQPPPTTLARGAFDLLRLAHTLDGHDGANRAPFEQLQFTANNDLEAVQNFLHEYRHSPGTQRIYQKECERLLLWSLHQRHKPLSSLNRQDFEIYLDFLSNPQPVQHWCGPRRSRDAPDWKPFVGPLSEAAKVTALAALNSLMTYLVDARYLAGNPLGLIRQRRKQAQMAHAPSLKVERFLDAEMWEAFNLAIEQLPRANDVDRQHYERARFLAALLLMMAPRAGELETHRMNSFREIRGRWWWYVVGKGNKPARVPVPDDMLTALMRYRTHQGWSALPSPSDQMPLLCSLKGRKAITARRLNQILKQLFKSAACLIETTAPHKATKLRQASAHWGRHTSITAKVDSGIEARYVQRVARHEDARTTALYIHETDERWHDEAQRHRLPWNQAPSKKPDPPTST